MEREERGEVQTEGEAERHAAATEVDQGRGAQRYPSEDEHAYQFLVIVISSNGV